MAAKAPEPEHGPERLNMLCDGVVAIAITFLALEIKMPEDWHGSVADLLHHQVPTIGAFLLSFVVIAVFWLSHHRLTRDVVRTSRAFNVANLCFMLVLVSLNLPTSVLARYGSTDPLAVVLYATTVGAAGATLAAMTWLAHRESLYRSSLPPAGQPGYWGVGWPTFVFLASIPVALFDAGLAMHLWWAAALPMNELVRRLHSQARKTSVP